MYERFTDRARKIMQLANAEAQRFDHASVDTEHLLLALVREGSGVAAHVLKNLQVELAQVRQEVERLVIPGPHKTTGRLPLAPNAKRVIEYALAGAMDLKQDYLGSEHLLLGLLREQNGVAARALANLGVTLEKTKTETVDLLGRQ